MVIFIRVWIEFCSDTFTIFDHSVSGTKKSFFAQSVAYDEWQNIYTEKMMWSSGGETFSYISFDAAADEGGSKSNFEGVKKFPQGYLRGRFIKINPG